MTRHTVWGASAPPGTYSYYTDGTPSIWTAHGFYRTVTGISIDTVVGARLWVSAAALAANSSVTIRVWRGGQYDAGLGTVRTGFDSPLETKTMPITTTGWNTVDFTTPFTCAVGERIYIGVQYSNTAAYQHSGSLATPDAFLAENGMGFCLGAGSNERAVYKLGTDPIGVSSNNAIYGLDIIFDDGVGSDTTPPSVPTGLTVDSVTHNSASVHWTASTDDVAVTGYEVFKDGTSVGTTTGTSFTIDGCAASTTYGFTVRARDAVGNWSAQSSSVGFTTSAAPSAAGAWINHVTILSPGNGTTTKTAGPSAGTVLSGTRFTPTAGNMLLCVARGAVTFTTPTGWTAPSGAQAVNQGGLYAWWRTAAGGGDNLTTTNNASNYPTSFDFYEFPAGSTFVGTGQGSNGVASGANGATLTGLTGTKLIMFAAGRNLTATAGSASGSWSVGTEAVDTYYLRPSGTIDGSQYSLAHLTNFTGSSTVSAWTWAGGLSGPTTAETIVFAINVVESTPSTTGTISGALPKITGSITGASLDLGTINAPLPKLTGSVTGVVTNTGTLNASLPRVTSSIPGGVFLTIAQENALTDGVQDRAYWFTYPSDTIQGFARSSYYKPGQTARFSVNYNTAYTVQVWRLGWYGTGDGNARKVAEFAGTTTSQPAATVIPNSNGAVTCAAWSENVTWAIPGDATPGWYWLFMRNAGSTEFGGILFCVSDQDNKKPVLVVASDATWGAAYSGYGGNNVYGASVGVGSIGGRALCVTYDKPVLTRDNVPQTHFFNGELATLRFFERFGFEVGYTTCEQINNDPTVMDGRDLIVFSGHNEYISQRIRDKTAAVVAAGTNVVNLAANDFFWRVAYGDESGFPAGVTNTSTGRVMWCRKDTMTGPTGSGHTAGTPFTTQADWTGTWQDTRYTNRQPSTDLLGDRFIANGLRNDEVKVPFALKGAPIWRDVAPVQALTSGQEFAFGVGTAGMEWDMPDGTLPSVSLSSTTVTITSGAADINGEAYNLTGTYTHAFQMVRNGTGFIFNANTTQWGWALDNLHLRGSAIATAAAQQATLNVLYDLGATGVTTLITGASLVEPTSVSDVGTAYGLLPPITGTISGQLPAITGSISGASLTTGTVSGALPKITGSVSGQSLTIGTVAGTIPGITGSVTGANLPVTGTISGQLPPVLGAVTGESLTIGTLTAPLPVITGVITGDTLDVGGISATLPKITGSINGQVVTVGTVDGRLPVVTASVTGSLIDVITGTVQGALPKVVGAVPGSVTITGTAAGTIPRVTAFITYTDQAGDNPPPLIVISRSRQRQPAPIRLFRARRRT